MMIGHQQQYEFMVATAERGCLAQGYLIVGMNGVGKTTLATTFIQKLTCTATDAPCYRCQPCIQVSAHTHPDLMWVSLLPEKREIGIDQVRDAQAFVSVGSLSGGYRTVVVEGADLLTAEAGNAMLKTLEEPLGRTLFLLLAKDPRSVLPTLRSRCAVLHLAPVQVEIIALSLVQLGLNRPEAESLARESGGRPGLAVVLAADAARRDQLIAQGKLFLAILRNGWPELQSYLSNEFKSSSEDERGSIIAQIMLGTWIEVARDILLCRLGLTNLVRYQILRNELELVAGTIPILSAVRVVRRINQSRRALAANANVRLTIESLAINLMHI